MATPYSTIMKKFDDNLSEEEAGKIELFAKRQFLRNAISTYIATVSTITPNQNEQKIEEDLTEIELLLISLLMFDSYLDQEIFKYNKVLNVSNEFMQMSGATNRVRTLKDMKGDNKVKINNIITNTI